MDRWRSSTPSRPTPRSPTTRASRTSAEFAADLSDNWLVEIEVSEDDDDACFGPLTARAAWDLAVDLDDRRPGWAVSVVPLHVAGTADELVELFEDEAG